MNLIATSQLYFVYYNGAICISPGDAVHVAELFMCFSTHTCVLLVFSVVSLNISRFPCDYLSFSAQDIRLLLINLLSINCFAC